MVAAAPWEKEANEREIAELNAKADKRKKDDRELYKQKMEIAKKNIENLKENLKKEKEGKESLKRDNIILQEKLYIIYNKGDDSDNESVN